MSKNIVLTLSPDEASRVLEAIDLRHEALAEEYDLDDLTYVRGAPDWVFETIESLTHMGDVLEGAIIQLSKEEAQ